MPSDSSATSRWLNDILYHINLAQSFVAGLEYQDFENDLLRFHAVMRCLEIISEASRRLPNEVKARHPSIAWKEMAASGNVYRHDYDRIAPRRVWNTVQLALPPLRLAVEQELASRSR